MSQAAWQPGLEAAELRAQIRHWRRGRATATLGEVLSDYYVGIFSGLVFGAMLVNVLLTLGHETNRACVTAGCLTARAWLPWLTVLTVLAAGLAVSRLIGPMSAPPAEVSWLLSAPVDRTDLLRPRLRRLTSIAVLVPAVAGGCLALIAGLSWPAVALLVITAAAAGVAALGFAVRWQGSGSATVARATVALSLLAAAGVAWLTWGTGPRPDGPDAVPAPVAAVVAALAALGAVLLYRVAVTRLAALRSRDLAPGGQLSANLSGAFAGLDLSLVYDVVLAHRSRQRGGVRPVRLRSRLRSGATGAGATVAALAGRDLVRLRRAPLAPLWLLVVVLAAEVAVTADGDVLVPLVAIAVLWPATLPLLSALRVVSRGGSLLRQLPGPDGLVRLSTMLVPGSLCLLAGLLTAPALAQRPVTAWPDAVATAAAIGLAGFAAAARWVAGRPPDYRAPMMSTPAGALPPGAVAALARGWDITVLTAAPLLIWSDARGAAGSAALSLVVLAVVAGRSR